MHTVTSRVSVMCRSVKYTQDDVLTWLLSANNQQHHHRMMIQLTQLTQIIVQYCVYYLPQRLL